MPRPATGQVVQRGTQRGWVFALRFRAYGERHYVTLGAAEEGWTHQRAEEELENVLADVRRGIWRPPTPVSVSPAPLDPTFHEFASDWWAAKRLELRPNTAAAYENELSGHLLPFFASHRVSQITVQEVDRYRQSKVREDRLSAETINKHLVRLGQILDRAVEYELMARNPVKIGRRKLRVSRARPVHLDSAEHIAAMLEAATDLQRNASGGRRTIGRRALVATLIFAGLRASEACDLLWRDVDLAAGRIAVGRAKTSASYREVDMLPVLRDELLAWKTSAPATGVNDLVFPTAKGGRRDKDNLRARVVEPIAKRAGVLLARDGLQPLPHGVTPHKLRHTFASLLIALGRDPAYVMGQLGHTDARFTLRIYTHVMRRGDAERDALLALVEGRHWAPMGTGVGAVSLRPDDSDGPEDDESPDLAGLSGSGSDGTRTRDLRRDRPAL
jgi:integrase